MRGRCPATRAYFWQEKDGTCARGARMQPLWPGVFWDIGWCQLTILYYFFIVSFPSHFYSQWGNPHLIELISGRGFWWKRSWTPTRSGSRNDRRDTRKEQGTTINIYIYKHHSYHASSQLQDRSLPFPFDVLILFLEKMLRFHSFPRSHFHHTRSNFQKLDYTPTQPYVPGWSSIHFIGIIISCHYLPFI